MKSRDKILYFFVVFFGNLILKTLFIRESSFSYDEIISVKDTLLNFGHIKHEAEWDNNPPFYYYALWVWHQIFPINEFNSRFLSAIFMSAAFGLFFNFLVKYFNTKVALVTLVFLSLSNFMTFYAQETRAYALVVLLAVISTIQFFKYLEKTTILNLLLFSLIDFLLIYTHYIAGLILLAQFSYVVFYEKNIRMKFFLISGSSILVLTYLRFTKKQYLNILNYNHKSDFWLLPAKVSDLISASSALYYNLVGAIIFTLILLYYFINHKKLSDDGRHKLDVYHIIIGFGATLLLFCVGTIKAVFLSRYLIFVVPFATVFVVEKVYRIHKYGFLIILPILLIMLLNLNLFKEASMDYKGVAKLMKGVKKVNDVIVINKKDNLALFMYYFDKTNYLKYKNIDSLANSQNIYGVNEISEVDFLKRHTNKQIFLIQSFHKINKLSNNLLDYLNATNLVCYHSNFFQGIELSVFNN